MCGAENEICLDRELNCLAFHLHFFTVSNAKTLLLDLYGDLRGGLSVVVLGGFLKEEYEVVCKGDYEITFREGNEVRS